jgi:hypothetical protein
MKEKDIAVTKNETKTRGERDKDNQTKRDNKKG